jgi:hypothetical protein
LNQLNSKNGKDSSLALTALSHQLKVAAIPHTLQTPATAEDAQAVVRSKKPANAEVPAVAVKSLANAVATTTSFQSTTTRGMN